METSGRVSRKRLALLCLAALAPAGVLLYRLLTREPPIDRLTYNTLQAAIDGDAPAVAKHLPEYELKALGMNRSQAEVFLSEWVLPKLKDCRIDHLGAMQSSGGDLRGVVDADLALPNGDSASLRLTMERADEGPIVFLRHLLYDAWLVEYIQKEKPKYRNNLVIDAQVWGIQRDRDKLLEYGFKGFVKDDDESAPLLPLDKALKRLSRYQGGS